MMLPLPVEERSYSWVGNLLPVQLCAKVRPEDVRRVATLSRDMDDVGADQSDRMPIPGSYPLSGRGMHIFPDICIAQPWLVHLLYRYMRRD